MLTPFESISPSSRIWIYQSDRPLAPDDKAKIADYLSGYCESWNAHGSQLSSSFTILFDHFVILAVDESHLAASGCSIDTSVHAMQEVGRMTGVDFFNRELIAFRKEGVVLIPLKQLKKHYEAGTWDENTPAFDNSVQTRQQLEESWLKPAGSIWLKRYVSTSPVKS